MRSSRHFAFVKKLLDALRHHDLFAGAPTTRLLRIACAFHILYLNRGHALISNNEHFLPLSMFFVLNGSMEIVDNRLDSHMGTLAAGMFLCEFDAVLGRQSGWQGLTVRVASENATVATISHKQLVDTLSLMPHLLDDLIEHAADLYELNSLSKSQIAILPGTPVPIKAGSLSKLHFFSDINTKQLETWIDRDWITCSSFQGHQLVYVHEQPFMRSSASTLILLHGQVAVFRRDKFGVQDWLSQGIPWIPPVQDDNASARRRLIYTPELYLRAMDEKTLVIRVSLQALHLGDNDMYKENAFEQFTLEGSQPLLQVIHMDPAMGMLLANHSLTRPFEIGYSHPACNPLYSGRVRQSKRRHSLLIPNTEVQLMNMESRRKSHQSSQESLGVDPGFKESKNQTLNLQPLLADDYYLTRVIPLHHSLKKLSLNGCYFVTRIPNLLPDTLEYLDCTDCWSLAEIEKIPSNSLKTLILTGCSSFTKVHGPPPVLLTHIDFAHCPQVNDALVLSLIHRSTHSLVRLSLHHCTGVSDACLALPTCTILEHLDVSECPFVSDRGLFVLLRASRRSLKHLDLRHCPSLTTLQVLNGCSHLEYLDLRNNGLLSRPDFDLFATWIYGSQLNFLGIGWCTEEQVKNLLIKYFPSIKNLAISCRVRVKEEWENIGWKRAVERICLERNITVHFCPE